MALQADPLPKLDYIALAAHALSVPEDMFRSFAQISNADDEQTWVCQALACQTVEQER